MRDAGAGSDAECESQATMPDGQELPFFGRSSHVNDAEN
jgi:hypothetical protein